MTRAPFLSRCRLRRAPSRRPRQARPLLGLAVARTPASRAARTAEKHRRSVVGSVGRSSGRRSSVVGRRGAARWRCAGRRACAGQGACAGPSSSYTSSRRCLRRRRRGSRARPTGPPTSRRSPGGAARACQVRQTNAEEATRSGLGVAVATIAVLIAAVVPVVP